MKKPIDLAVELGQAIQQDERYIRYMMARQVNDENEELQKLIGEFNLKRISMQSEINKENKSEETVAHLDVEIKELYQKIMEDETMKTYNETKKELDALVGQINTIISYSLGGQPPEEGCGGNCSGCSGCH